MAPGQRTFFVESYVPRLDRKTAAVLSSRLRAAVTQLQREGVTLHWLQSFALIGEETYVWMVKAANADDVARVNRRAGLHGEHVAEIVTLETNGP